MSNLLSRPCATSPRRARAAAWLALLLLFLATHANAAELRWGGRNFQTTAADKPLADILRELAGAQNTTAVIDPKVSGTVSGKFSGLPLTILNSLCASNGLTWYYDGAFLFIEPASEARSEVLAVSSANAARIAETLNQLKIADSRYPMTVIDREGQANLHVSGPRRYVEMVRQTVKLIDQRVALADNAEVRMLPLKYAWAADFNLKRSGKEVAIPGVVSVLRSLYATTPPVTGGVRSGSSSQGGRAGPSRQSELRSRETVTAPKFGSAASAASDESPAPAPTTGANEGLPQFHADTRMNAVIVRDTPERMEQYVRLIEAMDVRPRLVEIELTIMDISSDTLDSLGIDWRLHTAHLDVQTGRGNRPAQTWSGATSESDPTSGLTPSGLSTTPLGSVFSAAIGHDLRNYLLARVNALAQTGNAQFVARPKVLTLDNNEAVLENMSEFFVRINGFQDASLFSVSTGTAVRVTPLIVDEKTGRSVMLSINIDDGDVSSISVDQIPIVRRRNVNTQALIDEGQSLLVAGYSSEEKTNVTSGVPLLSDIPGIGRLFKYSDKKQVNMERFYLLTPRLVVPGAVAGAAPATPPATVPVPPPPAPANRLGAEP